MKKNLKKRLGVWAIVVAGILMIPFLTRAPWTLGDFIFAFIVLFGSATIYEILTRNARNQGYRILIAVLSLLIVLSIWAWAVA